MKQLLIATRNHTKTLLFGPIFQSYGFEVLTLKEIQTDETPLPETAHTAAENALAKAQRYFSEGYPWVFGTDSGLEIDALNGEPGLQTRRWGGRFSDDVDDQSWLDYLLERLQGVPPEQRTASFVTAWALIAPDGSQYIRNVRTPFMIATKPLRPISPGSPISAVRVGPEDAVGDRRRELQREWERWNIMESLLAKFQA